MHLSIESENTGRKSHDGQEYLINRRPHTRPPRLSPPQADDGGQADYTALVVADACH